MPDNSQLEIPINYSHYIGDTTLLGPYHRGVLWVQRCCFSCEGCVAQTMRKEGGAFASAGQFADYFLRQPIEGVTFSGGEPFLQAEALTALIRLLRDKSDMGLIVYSGLYLNEIQLLAEKNAAAGDFLSEIDLLIDGRYDKQLDDGRMAVGSSNQTIHVLTDRYRDCAEAYYHYNGRKIEIRFFGNRAQMIGVPSAEGLKLWKGLVNTSYETTSGTK